MVMALTAEMSIDTEIVSANWRKNWPVMPPRKALGSSTELSTSVMARIGPVISFIALMVASRTGQALVQPALDVLQHDDGVVHDDADGQHQPEQGQVVQREAHQLHDGEGADQRHRHVDHGQEQGLPVLQEQAGRRWRPG